MVKAIILKAYYFRGSKKGARQIKMTLQNQYLITYNLKRIRRIIVWRKQRKSTERVKIPYNFTLNKV
ncbi:hypothetical protein DCE79_16205 [Lysinibacillus sp. 2017]|nr:hypothetical protein DCE79_16205 [Lysinibacillus sp. 2017]TGN36126.1 hypothetical protein E4L99_06585 [Lysinibacillus sp. S2017]